MGMVAPQLGWNEKLTDAQGGNCDISLDDYEIKELLKIEFKRKPTGSVAELTDAQAELLNPYVPAVIDTEKYCYEIWIPDDFAPYGC